HQEHLHRLDLEVLDDEGHRVGADPEVRGVPERQEAGVAEEQVEAEGGDGEDQPVGQEHRLVRGHHEGQDGEHGEDGHRPPRRAARRPPRAHARPNSPAGRMRRTMAAIRYSTASSISGKNVIPNSRTMPTRRAPTSAPSRLPRPPITTTTKARISASTPMPSTAPCCGTTTAPPRPAMKQPRLNAWTYTRLPLPPRAEARRMFWEVARSTTPNWVRYTKAQIPAAARPPTTMTTRL